MPASGPESKQLSPLKGEVILPGPARAAAAPRIITLLSNPIMLMLPLVVLVVGVLASSLVHAELQRRALVAWKEATQNETDGLSAAFIDTLRTVQPPLRAITGLFLGSEEVTAPEFRQAIVALTPSDSGTEPISMAYLEARPDGTYVMPFGTGLAKFGPIATMPERWANLRAISLMAGAEPLRILLTKEPLFTDPLGERFALILALRGGANPPLLVMPLDLEKQMATFAAGHVPEGLRLSVAHRAIAQGKLYNVAYRPLPDYPAANGALLSPHSLTSTQLLWAAEWQLTWLIAPDYRGGPDYSLAHAVLVGGIGFSLLCAILFMIARYEARRERALAVAAKQNAEMFRQHMMDIAQARDAAERANRAKSDFLAHMSHELRTPLNAIIGFSDMMKLGIGGKIENEKHLECVHHISDSGTLLFRLIDQLFDTAKIESGQIDIEEMPHDAADLAREAIALIEPAARAKQIRLELACGPDLPMWLVDHRSALQILNNLLTNAVKFSGRQSLVTMRLERLADDGLGIAVIDQGPGISPDVLPRIFDRFARGDAMVAAKDEGLGLGLWIVRNLVEMHRGEISVSSEQGRGTTIQMRFPPR